MHASVLIDRSGTGTQIWWGKGAGYGLLLSALGKRSPGEGVSDPYSTASLCSAGASGLVQICYFSAELQRCFGVKFISFRGTGLQNLTLHSNLNKQAQKRDG